MNTISRTSTLEEILDTVEFPSNAVFMGVAEDGNPVLFDVLNPSSPNILIWNGSVDILKVIAEYIMRIQKGTRRKTDVEFLVLTSDPDKWKFLYQMKAEEMKQTPCIAVAPLWSDLADQLIMSLSSWIHESKKSTKTVLVLVDDVVRLQGEFPWVDDWNFQQDGTQVGVWVVPLPPVLLHSEFCVVFL